MRLQLLRKSVTLSMITLCLFTSIPKGYAVGVDPVSVQEGMSVDDKMDYETYLEQYADKLETIDNNRGLEGLIVNASEGISKQDGLVSYEIKIPQAGMYNIEVKYCPLEGKGAPIIRSLQINGEVPFQEADSIAFERLWTDASKDYLMKSDGNQSFPMQIEMPEWRVKKLVASNGYHSEPLMFYFEEGNNTITFDVKQEPMKIEYIKLIPAQPTLNYQDYKQTLLENGAEIITNNQLDQEAIMIQAEDAYYKTTASLIPVNDRTSVKNMPYHPSNIVMNTIGGDSWSTPGDTITWQVQVPESGFYKIATRSKQISNRDFYSVRKLEINGEIPFKEATELKFNYKSKFQLEYLGNDQEAYYFYLEKGTNEISMSVSLGELGESIGEVEKSIKALNRLYLNITNITGVVADPYRDYKLTTLIPGLISTLEDEYNRLEGVLENFGELAGQKTTEITKMTYQLEKFIAKPANIAKEISAFNDNISALSQWTIALQKQPLLLDYLLICGDGYELGDSEGNWLQGMKHSVLAFIGSFTNNYAVKGSSDDIPDKKSIEVWISTPRDQYQVVQRLVNEQYSNQDIEVILKMVGAGTIMPATVTGNGPDVALQLDGITPTNFAFRNAAYDLTQFEDFEEVSRMFSPAAMEYFKYQEGYYALPDQMSFPVMFYRKDILEELNLEIPNTWDEFLEIIPYLQSNNMDIYMMTPAGAVLNPIFVSMLYQEGQGIYVGDGEQSNLSNDESLQVFKEWTEYYTKHNFSVTIDFLTRFRTGSVPLAIVDFTNYNTLKASAPEIEGDWSIAPMPGTLKEDGSIDRSIANTAGASMIIKNTVEEKGTEEEAWEFLKWWTSSQTQVNYVQGLEAVLGTAARYPASNLEAISQISWDKEELETIQETISNLRGIPQVPGGYITGRYVENAFLKVVNGNFNPVDTLYPLIEYIDQELSNKRTEFGMTTK